MILTWQKVALIIAIVATFALLSALKVISTDVVTHTVTLMIGWLGGLFVPTDKQASAPLSAVLSDTLSDKSKPVSDSKQDKSL